MNPGWRDNLPQTVDVDGYQGAVCDSPSMSTTTHRQPPLDVNDLAVQRACRAVARWLLGAAGEEEARRTAPAVMIAATEERGRE